MSKKLIWRAVLAGLVVLSATYVERLGATPKQGFSGMTIALGRFGDIDVLNQLVRESDDLTPTKDLWLSLQRAKGLSDLYVQSNEWQVGGSTGWHSHPGHSLIIVVAGEDDRL